MSVLKPVRSRADPRKRAGKAGRHFPPANSVGAIFETVATMDLEEPSENPDWGRANA